MIIVLILVKIIQLKKTIVNFKLNVTKLIFRYKINIIFNRGIKWVTFRKK